MRDLLITIAQNYAAARQQPFRGHWLATTIQNELPAAIQDNLSYYGEQLKIKGSPGISSWAYVPWIGVFDKVVTSTAVSGYYIAYLFNIADNRIALSLIQGSDALSRRYGKRRSRAILQDCAARLRELVDDYAGDFPLLQIQLGAPRRVRLPTLYQAAHIMGKEYALEALPAEEELCEDLEHLTNAYLALTFRGGPDLLEAHHNPAAENPQDQDNEDVIEQRKYVFHRRIERSPGVGERVKKALGFRCQVCNLKFDEMYPGIGEGYIEAHHLQPLSELEEGDRVKYNVKHDFAVLCSNCHRMIHKTEDPSDLEHLKSLINSRA